MAGLPRHARSRPQRSLIFRDPRPPSCQWCEGGLHIQALFTATAPGSSTRYAENELADQSLAPQPDEFPSSENRLVQVPVLLSLARIWNNTRHCNSTQLVPTQPGRLSTPRDAAVHLVEHLQAPEIRQVFQRLAGPAPPPPVGRLLPAAAGGYYKRPKAAPTRAQRF